MKERARGKNFGLKTWHNAKEGRALGDDMNPVVRMMSRSLVGVSPSTDVEQAQAVAADSGVEHLLVLDGDDLVGVTSVDVLRHARIGATVSDCMNAAVPTIRPTASTDEAAELMHRYHIACLPVVAGSLIIGVVTRELLPPNA